MRNGFSIFLTEHANYKFEHTPPINVYSLINHTFDACYKTYTETEIKKLKYRFNYLKYCFNAVITKNTITVNIFQQEVIQQTGNI